MIEKTRAVSVNIVDALTAIKSGFIPLEKQGIEKVLGTALAVELKRKDFETASFSSRELVSANSILCCFL